jgi:hypothetical protein
MYITPTERFLQKPSDVVRLADNITLSGCRDLASSMLKQRRSQLHECRRIGRLYISSVAGIGKLVRQHAAAGHRRSTVYLFYAHAQRCHLLPRSLVESTGAKITRLTLHATEVRGYLVDTHRAPPTRAVPVKRSSVNDENAPADCSVLTPDVSRGNIFGEDFNAEIRYKTMGWQVEPEQELNRVPGRHLAHDCGSRK